MAWSTASLSVPRSDLAATSVSAYGLAIFAGGQSDTGRVVLSRILPPRVFIIAWMIPSLYPFASSKGLRPASH